MYMDCSTAQLEPRNLVLSSSVYINIYAWLRNETRNHSVWEFGMDQLLYEHQMA